MNWFIAALVGLIFISIGWLILKKIQLRGVSHEDSLSQWFFFVAITLLVWHLLSKTPILLANPLNSALLVLAAMFAAATNLLVLHSFERSANPGLSLALSSTQMLWLTFASIGFFGSVISLLSGIGILLVLGGIACMYVRKAKGDFKWGLLALAAGLMSAAYWVIVKWVQLADPHLIPTTILLYVSVPQIPVFLLVKKCRPRKKKAHFSFAILGMLAVGGIVGALGNVSNIFSVTNAPNPGYALAVGSAGVLVTLFASIPLFKARITWRQLLAAIIIVAGVVAIRLGS